MTRKIFIWVAHPKATSLCSALVDAYQSGAEGQHLCMRSRAYWHPLSIFRDEGIRHDCQFSNDRSDCDFERLSVFPEPFIESGEVSV